jgi:hypothetical protein
LASWLKRQAERAERTGRVEPAAEARAQEAVARDLSRSLHRSFLDKDPIGAAGRALEAMGLARSAA